VTESWVPFAENFLKTKLSQIMGEAVQLIKINLISKSRYATNVVPCHQDLAYAADQPYDFSLWLPLQEVTSQEGVLEILPQSHLGPIEPAIDFWQPHFIDERGLSSHWKKNAIAIPLTLGQGILFDSRTWHRSAEHLSHRLRLVMVTRWRFKSSPLTHEIPDKHHVPFGMWTCGAYTEQLLQKGLAVCFHETLALPLERCIQSWQEKLPAAVIPFKVDIPKVQRALYQLFILHQGSRLHNGGDAHGIVYPQLWHCFLRPLSEWLEKRT
jgi:hypothetical protein